MSQISQFIPRTFGNLEAEIAIREFLRSRPQALNRQIDDAQNEEPAQTHNHEQGSSCDREHQPAALRKLGIRLRQRKIGIKYSEYPLAGRMGVTLRIRARWLILNRCDDAQNALPVI